MTPFRKVEVDPSTSMERRLALLEQPDEFFRPFFGGRRPSLEERAAYVERMVQRITSINIYENDIYHVEVNVRTPFIQLDIRRRDGERCNNWRELQQIKNEIVGPEHEAIELFPAESRLVDTANQYHLWVHATPGFRFPLGFNDRVVFSAPITSRCGQIAMEGTR